MAEESASLITKRILSDIMYNLKMKNYERIITQRIYMFTNPKEESNTFSMYF